MWLLAIPMLLLATLVAVGNLGGCIAAVRRQRAGGDKGFSSIPFVSLILSCASYALAGDKLGLLVFLPALIDPGTLMALYFPVVIWNEFIKPKFQK